MRTALFALGLALVLLTPLPDPSGLSIVQRAEALPSEALMLKCRKAVFRKYARRNNRGRRVLPAHFVIRNVDACVANGGRVI
jgi:hypothetical protein